MPTSQRILAGTNFFFMVGIYISYFPKLTTPQIYNLRATFAGNLASPKRISPHTAKGIKPFQRNYMKMDKPTGIVHDAALQKSTIKITENPKPLLQFFEL